MKRSGMGGGRARPKAAFAALIRATRATAGTRNSAMNEHEAYRRRLSMKPNADLYLLPNRSNFMRPLHPDERKYDPAQAPVNSSPPAPANSPSYDQELEALRRGAPGITILGSHREGGLPMGRLVRTY